MEQLGASRQLLEWIEEGVLVVWNREAKRRLGKQGLNCDQGRSLEQLSPDEAQFLEAEIERLLAIGAWEECPALRRAQSVGLLGSARFF